jgi:hypothetical protein
MNFDGGVRIYRPSSLLENPVAFLVVVPAEAGIQVREVPEFRVALPRSVIRVARNDE